jgi:hypothetical protein
MTQEGQSERVSTTNRNLWFGWVARPLTQAVLTSLAIIIVLGTTSLLSVTTVAGQSHTARHRAKRGSICGNPTAPCKTSVTFHEYDLPFRVPANAVIFDTELFYAIILKSVAAPEDDCNAFVSETDRLAAQSLFPDRKVFSSRCIEPGELFYTNLSEKHRIMAVYAGTTLAEAKRTLATVKATANFPGAYLRRMRTGFNGT